MVIALKWPAENYNRDTSKRDALNARDSSLKWNTDMINVLSLFDGMSCGQIALKELGIPVNKYYASEIDKHAIKQTATSFPNTIHLGDVCSVKASDLEEIDLVLAGSPCFVAGTKIITDTDICNIEDVQVGTKVLTHKGNYKKVLRIGDQQSTVYQLKSQSGTITETTAEHPYYVRKRTKVWNNDRRSDEYRFSDPEFVAVRDLTKDHYLGTPILTSSKNPHNLTDEECFLIGFYIGDGHTRKDYRTSGNRPNDRHWQMILSIGESKIDRIKSNVNLRFSLYKHTKGTYRAVFSNKKLVQYVEANCGCSAKNKKFGKAILDLPKPLLKRVIEGYLAADGSVRRNAQRASSISRELVETLTLAVAKVYETTTTVEFTERQKATVIEGRTVNQSDTWSITFRKEHPKQSRSWVIDGYIWNPITLLEKTDRIEQVYNLEVEDDNSYVANNHAVHNCQGFSFAGKQLAFDDPRSKLFFEFVRIWKEVKAINPNAKFLLENVVMKKEHQKVINDYMGLFPVHIDSALVSAQQRKRLYWTNIRTRQEGLFGELHSDIPQPEDKGIILKHVLQPEDEIDEKYYLSEKAINYLFRDEMNTRFMQSEHNNKSQCITANYHKGTPYNVMCVAMRGRNPENPSDRTAGSPTEQRLEPRKDQKTNTITTVGKDNLILQLTPKKEGEKHVQQQNRVYDPEGKMPALLSELGGRNNIAIKQNYVQWDVSGKGHNSQQDRAFFPDGKHGSLAHQRADTKNGVAFVNEDSLTLRRLTPLECQRLQTIPEWYKWHVSDTQIYKMLGNGWTVDVIKHIISFW